MAGPKTVFITGDHQRIVRVHNADANVAKKIITATTTPPVSGSRRSLRTTVEAVTVSPGV